MLAFQNEYTQRKQTILDLGGWSEDYTFKTAKVPLMTNPGFPETGKEIESKKALVNVNTGDFLAIVGNKYTNNYSHMEQFTTVENRIAKSSLDLSEMSREVSVSHDGARAYARYRFPAHEVNIGGTGKVNLEILCRNSFDGTWPTIFEGGAWRMVCTNLCVFGDTFAVSKQRHTKNINYEKGAQDVMNCLTAFMAEADKWNEWRNMPVTDAQAFQILAKISGNIHAIQNIDNVMAHRVDLYGVIQEAIQTKKGNTRTNSPLNTLWTLWKQDYKPILGDNLWALYNVLTDWSTKHQSPRKESGATVTSLQTQAFEKVRKVITTDNIFKIAA